jgi:predicted nuclease of predicted toxin-antitoxin system
VRFLLDQHIDARILFYLSERGHDVTRVARHYPAGLPDRDILATAYREQRILVTHDRDFGELVFVHLLPHAGVILLRLGPLVPLATTTSRLDHVLSQHAHELDQFVVVTHNLVRVRR